MKNPNQAGEREAIVTTPRRNYLKKMHRGMLVANIIPLMVVVIWYLSSLRLPEFVIPNPIQVAVITFKLFFYPSLLVHTLVSLGRVLISVTLAVFIGSALVLAARYIPITRQFVGTRLIPFLNSFPSLGWAMLAVIWFGVSNPSVIFVETAILLPFCMINMWEGFKTLDEELLEMSVSFTRNKRKVLMKVILPLLFPHIFSALRISYGVGWKISLIAELFGARTGLGYLLNLARQSFDTPLMFGTIVVIIILVGLFDNIIFKYFENRMLKYRME